MANKYQVWYHLKQAPEILDNWIITYGDGEDEAVTWAIPDIMFSISLLDAFGRKLYNIVDVNVNEDDIIIDKIILEEKLNYDFWYKGKFYYKLGIKNEIDQKSRT
jgi:hypothetical protein